MTRASFSKSDVDFLVKEPKFIRFVPRQNASGNVIQIQAAVFKNSERSTAIKGLFVKATVDKSLSGISKRPRPSCCLDYKGQRIRGIDFEQWHDNPDGTRILGWHEHLWSVEWGDSLVIGIPEPRQKHLRAILKCGLERWNIAVLLQQEELL